MSKKMTKTIGLIFAFVIILGLVIFVWLKPPYPTDGTIVLSAGQDEVATTVTIEAENGRVQTVKYENMMYYSDLGDDGTREALESQHDTHMKQYEELNGVDGFEGRYICEDDLKTENYIKHLEGLGLEME